MNFKYLAIAPMVLSVALASAVEIPKGTPVTLEFDQSLSSKQAKAGDVVHMHVRNDVVYHGRVIVRAGTPERAVISKVSGRGRFGKNASIQLTLNPVKSEMGGTIPLQPRTAGKSFQGSRTDHAALISGAGAVVLGPVGLVGGIFVQGKEVHIKPGDKLESETSRDVHF